MIKGNSISGKLQLFLDLIGRNDLRYEIPDLDKEEQTILYKNLKYLIEIETEKAVNKKELH
ncbi:hypothetical protein JCM21714_2095 [Gracilibacillus boraciitolerans JCM 21714]|uniref:Uncharacterized protein n=1 Tax=Gracilibacillus boraciitolerans JCM 21714 TaxID=1298598 RepID=W4VI33_9BACI|nr:hypothetical protein [Gracilibacillus boraciitolerans]GAE93060.1 hypothetical protein JCM21714_2095 [Gracilibacillus boraciitolerans JCM 21714]